MLKTHDNPSMAGIGDTFACLYLAGQPTPGPTLFAGQWMASTPLVTRSCDQEINHLPKKELKFETITNRFKILLGNNDILLE
jgi:hypothetical protein